jgi:hypothetical protein
MILQSFLTLHIFPEDEPNFEGVSEHVEDSHHQELVAISAWLKKPEVINSFRCSEIKESGHAYSRYNSPLLS